MVNYAKRVGVNVEGLGAHSLRATAATNALDHEATSPRCRSGSGMPDSEPSLRAELARVTSNLAVRLRNFGQRPEALPPTEEAVKLRRQLFEQNPDAFRPDLAKSLNNLAIRLSELGRQPEAVPPG